MPMPAVNEFAYGLVNPLIAFAMALVGGLFGLMCLARVRRSANRRLRARWLLLASAATGGVGIWLPHMMAMLGFEIPNSQLRYNVGETTGSIVIAVLGAAAALLIVGREQPSLLQIMLGGLILGGAVSAMHFAGVAATRFEGQYGYNLRIVAASVLVAVLGSTLALWLTVSTKRNGGVFAGAATFGLMVCTMHYTAMAALSLHMSIGATGLSGVEPDAFAVPLVIGGILALLGMLFAALNLGTDDDLARRLDHRIADSEGTPVRITWQVPRQQPANPASLSDYERAYAHSVLRGHRDRSPLGGQ